MRNKNTQIDKQNYAINPYRVRQSDLPGAIYRPLDEQGKPQAKDTREILTFCFIGTEDEQVNLFGQEEDEGFPLLWDAERDGETIISNQRKEACAYCSLTSERKRFFIKQNNSGQFYNPIGLYEELNYNRHIKNVDKPVWSYKEVGRKSFEYYLNFLKNKNVAWLKNAEREAI